MISVHYLNDVQLLPGGCIILCLLCLYLKLKGVYVFIMDYIFERPDFTEWVIIIKDRSFDKLQEKQLFGRTGDFEEFSGVFRTGVSNGKECEMFTLLSKDIDYAYLWVNIFKNGDVEYVTHIPSVINTDKKHKIIEILPLVFCDYNSKYNTFKFNYIEDYKLNSNIVYE